MPLAALSRSMLTGFMLLFQGVGCSPVCRTQQDAHAGLSYQVFPCAKKHPVVSGGADYAILAGCEAYVS